jgi:GMP synthase-like glutamine amidotransferase
MYLIIQSRTDQSGWHELKCLYEASGLRYNELQVLNASSKFVTSDILLQACRQADSVIIGGLGEVGYGEQDPAKRRWFNELQHKLIPVLAAVIDNDDACVLGICLGHQLLAEALGGTVKYAPKQAEVGVTELKLTAAGQVDPLFAGVPARFRVIEAHKDMVVEVPPHTVLLASSERCPIQAFRYKKHVYGVQFHPELSAKEYDFRVSQYQAYARHDPNRGASLSQPLHNSQIIKNFLNACRDVTPPR